MYRAVMQHEQEHEQTESGSPPGDHKYSYVDSRWLHEATCKIPMPWQVWSGQLGAADHIRAAAVAA